MIGTRGAEFSKPRPIYAVHKPKHLQIVLNGSNESTIYRNLTTDEGNHFSLNTSSCGTVQGFIFWTSECFLTFIVGFDKLGRAVNDLESRFITRLVTVVPRAHAMMTEQYSPRLRIILNELFDLQTDVEAWSLPRNVD